MLLLALTSDLVCLLAAHMNKLHEAMRLPVGGVSGELGKLEVMYNKQNMYKIWGQSSLSVGHAEYSEYLFNNGLSLSMWNKYTSVYLSIFLHFFIVAKYM